ncbi:MAG: T9SS type A sorting domain-containing protein, partial [Salibacter sp.]|uniref:T9SS type A sorting domain-containing protein n=1 Tax=Salibacter sp. TaxID=2010995 RepID=UPI00287069D9
NQAIHVQNNTSTRIEECKVYDINGKVVFYSSKNKSSYPVFKLSKGMYFIDFTFDNKKHHKAKFIVR